MEFIPLERYSKRIKNKKKVEKQNLEKIKKLTADGTSKSVTLKKTKLKGRTKVFGKKNVKNKYKETLALKQKKRVPKKKKQKKDEEEEEEEEEDDEEGEGEGKGEGEGEEEEEEEGEEEENDDEKEEEMQLDEEEDDSQGEDEEDEEQEKDDQEAFKKKCQEMDEKKKNRLFLKLNKKILNKSQVLKLHPDIKDVILPRKKYSRWCWIVFTSEEKANKALTKLFKNKEILVKKPTAYDEVSKRRKEKMKTVLKKKNASKKLQKMWM